MNIGFLQGRFRLIDVEGGGNPGIFLSLGSVLTKGVWFSSCGINSNSSQLTYQCSIFIDGEDVVEYTTDSIKIEKDDWHTAKMEINPQTKEITFFLDNLIIGQHTPSDKELLNNSNMWILFGVHKGYYQDKIIAEIDDILLARYP